MKCANLEITYIHVYLLTVLVGLIIYYLLMYLVYILLFNTITKNDIMLSIISTINLKIALFFFVL